MVSGPPGPSTAPSRSHGCYCFCGCGKALREMSPAKPRAHRSTQGDAIPRTGKLAGLLERLKAHRFHPNFSRSRQGLWINRVPPGRGWPHLDPPPPLAARANFHPSLHRPMGRRGVEWSRESNSGTRASPTRAVSTNPRTHRSPGEGPIQHTGGSKVGPGRTQNH